MPPIFNSGTVSEPIHQALQILNFFNLEEVVNSLNMTSQMQFLLDRNDKIAIGSSKIFYLDPYTLRNFEDSHNYCTNLNMTMALPTNKSENKLMAKLMRKWNSYIKTPKFDSIETWLAVGFSDKQLRGEFIRVVFASLNYKFQSTIVLTNTILIGKKPAPDTNAMFFHWQEIERIHIKLHLISKIGRGTSLIIGKIWNQMLL